jgi:feruloyl-CoA synthase
MVRPDETLEPYPRVLTDRVAHWATVAPDRVCIAKRVAGGEWSWLTYAQVMAGIRSVGQALLDRGLSSERPVAILSENDLDHFLLMLAGQHVGIPIAPLSPSYSLLSKDLARLRHAVNLLTPGLVFAASGERYQRAIEAVVSEDTELVVTSAPPAGRKVTFFSDLLATSPTPSVDTAHARIDPDGLAKVLFTSGSTDLPKGVMNTHRMLCSNQQQICQVFRFLREEPPVLVDWLPWHHTFAGNHDIGITLYNGGSYYIDEGKPGREFIGETIRNLREISPTAMFNVPKGYEDLLPALRSDAHLRKTFFARLRLLFYAAAGMSQPVWDAYRHLAAEECGERILMVTGLGCTETAPMAIQCTWETEHPGAIGIPVPGVELKLAPQAQKLEARVRGPNVTPGYWRQPELTARAFDEDGFYRFGDAVRFVDPVDVNKGFFFDGRFGEDFKLSSGTWVSVGPLRGRIVAHFAPFVRDVVVTGHDRDDVGVLLFADQEACSSLCSAGSRSLSARELFHHEAVLTHFLSLLRSFAAQATGSSNRVVRALLLEEPPSLDAGEITDKGSLNQRAVLRSRAALVERLYSPNSDPGILRVETD